MSDYWGFCSEWKGGLLRAFFVNKSKEFSQHILKCERCKEAQKRYNDFQVELSKCANGDCGHGHAGDPPGSFGGSDF